MTKQVVPRQPDQVILAGEPNNAPHFSFQDMQRMAASIAKSGLFGVKEPDQALALMLIAQGEGRHPALVARDYHIINNRPAKTSEAILRDFQASGGRVEWHELTDKMASATFTHPSSVKPVKIEWDIPRAKQAGLMDKPGGMYAKYPRQMLRSRCVSEGCRTVAPSSTSGFYSVEEVSQMEEAPATVVSENKAVALAVECLPDDEADALVNAMDVSTLPELETAFAAAWRATKDAKQRQRFKAVYDSMKQELQDQAAQAAGGSDGQG